jgi:phosphopantothenoylcysteine decarboxylase/phosphopantothenate--cysteine ligase
VTRLAGRRVLLIIGGGVAAYKTLELIRLLRRAECAVTCVLTAGGGHFVTALSLRALSGNQVHTDLWSMTDDNGMGHIELSRSADLVVVAPATADLLARMAAGLADDLATTLLLATDTRVLVAPAMNVRMWLHPAIAAAMATLTGRGVAVVGPDEGAMACGEFGPGRLAEPPIILDAIAELLASDPPAPGRGAPHPLATGPLAGRHALVTSGPTHEAIDPVRYIANRSSGRQGHAIARALAAAGARVTLVSGPVALADPPGVSVRHVETGRQMLDACLDALPADVAVFAAAVADWRVAPAEQKHKKSDGPPRLDWTENPDILATVAAPGPRRPRLVVGFAAETQALLDHADAKRARKGCDWIVANDVGAGTDTLGGADNQVWLLTATGVEAWPRASKDAVAARLVDRIAAVFA